MWPTAKFGVSPQEAARMGRKTMAKVCVLRNVVFLKWYFNRLRKNARNEANKETSKKIMTRTIVKNEHIFKKLMLRDSFNRLAKHVQNALNKEFKQSFAVKLMNKVGKKQDKNLLSDYLAFWRDYIRYLNKVDETGQKVKLK